MTDKTQTLPGTRFFVPLEDATTPAEGHCYVNRWWAVHPEKGVAFYAQLLGYARSEEPHPQCNQQEHTARHLQEELWPDCETRFIPVVYARHAEKEMARLRKEALENL